MNFFQKVKSYERIQSVMRPFGDPAENFPMSRVKLVLENGIEIILEKQGQEPQWSFSVSPNRPLGAKYNIEGDDKITSVELSGSLEVHKAFNDVMEGNEIRDGIREGLKPLGGLIQDMAIERRQWLSTLVPNRSVLRIRFIRGGEILGVYQCHDDKTITVANTIRMDVVGWMTIDGVDQLG